MMAKKLTLIGISLLLAGTYVSGQQAYKGWPSATGEIDIRSNFINPPKGYGNVPFYWWSGDSLDIDRLVSQLDILSDASTDGLCVSYNHTDAKVDVELNANGHGPCGRVSGGKPRLMTPEWRDIWNDFSSICGTKQIGLGMDDYVIAWPKNMEFIDDILNEPSFKNFQGRLKMDKMRKGAELPEHVVTTIPQEDGSVLVFHTVPSPELHPEYGKKVIELYFQPFEDSMDESGRNGMNYFFQDELQYDLGIDSWCDELPAIFLEKKGYDIIPYLPAIFENDPSKLNERSVQARLDYAEVIMDIAEDRYFKPIYEWNNKRGLIYGCDNEGRGLNPTRYLDYFRATSWFTAPGNDAPARGSSFRQTKVSSSIAHLYQRPRTWLEAFHSMGWDANGGILTRQLDHHLIAGGNLLCMHGLYYSTHGGWWEWAPPCFHFRMPYWPHMKHLLKYSERMCFLLSQGYHVCDVAILYPTETMQVYPDSKPNLAFDVSSVLSEHGIDYDFIDYKSIQNARTDGGLLTVGDESYKILILADIKALHTSTAERIREFVERGGKVIAVGDYPRDIDRSVKYDANNISGVPYCVHRLLAADFSTESGNGKVLHRKIGGYDLYMVMDIAKGDLMHFRCKGKAEKWDAMHGTIKPLPIERTDANGTWIRYDGEDNNSLLVVFSQGNPEFASKDQGSKVKTQTERIEGEWDIEIIPTMDNRWGDFRLPASKEMIGVEAREFKWSYSDNEQIFDKDNSVRSSIYGYGPHMLTLNIDNRESLNKYLEHDIEQGDWQPYEFSWQYGVFDNPGSQGYHGLKSHVEDNFLILDQGCTQLFYTEFYTPGKGAYRIVTSGVEADAMRIDRKELSDRVVFLDKGWHKLTLAYRNTEKKEFILEKARVYTRDERKRSMVAVYPVSETGPGIQNPYGDIVASGWYGTPHMIFDVTNGKRCMYRFETAPGTKEIKFAVRGSIENISIDGKPAQALKCTYSSPNGVSRYSLNIDKANQHVSSVTVYAHPLPGYPGASFFEEPVKMKCSGGVLCEGDWSQEGALKFFSGGIRYTKDIKLGKISDEVILDLGTVDATCEVSINGKPVDVLLGQPYKLDITDYVRKGDNHIDILVYSSLSNHYQTVPSPYKGKPCAGLIGPVQLIQN